MSVAAAPAIEFRAAAGYRWLAVGACSVAFFAMCLDGGMVIAFLPRLGQELGLAPQNAVWLLLAGSLATVGLMLPAGRWADASGNRTAFLVGSVGFAGSAALAGLAPSVGWLLLARALEGGFTALLLVLVMTVAVEAAGPDGRARAVGVVTAAGPLGSMAGPQLAALLLPAFGWRSIFLASLPLALLATLIGLLAVPGERHLAVPRPRWLVEAAALSVSVGALLLLLRQLPVADRSLPADAALAVLVAGGLFVWTRLPQARGIFKLIGARRMATPLFGLAAMAVTAGVVGFTVPYFLLGELHATLQAAAATFIALAFGQTLASAFGGYAMGRWGSAPVAHVGAVVLALGLLLLLPLNPAWSAADIGWRLGVIGVGTGFVAGCNQSVVMGLAPWHHESSASAVSGVMRNLLYAIGAALASVFAAFAPVPVMGLRVAIGLGLAAALLAVAASVRGRALMERLDHLDHHPAPQAAPAPLHRLDGLAHDPDHPRYQEPEPLHPRAADQA